MSYDINLANLHTLAEIWNVPRAINQWKVAVLIMIPGPYGVVNIDRPNSEAKESNTKFVYSNPLCA